MIFVNKVGDENLDMNAMNRKRLERDLQELKKLIAIHFEQRKKDEEDLESLKVNQHENFLFEMKNSCIIHTP